MSDPVDDRILEEYLHRKSALSMGYRRVYVEAPPAELDRAITARARRALRWLVPGALSVGIVCVVFVGLNLGVGKLMGTMKSAEQQMNRIKEERKQREEQERLNGPVTVIVDPQSLGAPRAESPAQLTREQWLANIDALRRAGKTAEAEAELRRLNAIYPETKSTPK